VTDPLQDQTCKRGFRVPKREDGIFPSARHAVEVKLHRDDGRRDGFLRHFLGVRRVRGMSCREVEFLVMWVRWEEYFICNTI
jgi:hypothetical protein